MTSYTSCGGTVGLSESDPLVQGSIPTPAGNVLAVVQTRIDIGLVETRSDIGMSERV